MKRRDSTSLYVERALHAWGVNVAIERRITDGHRNAVWAVKIEGRRYAARLSRRSGEALDWEIGLLEYLRAHDFRVPAILRTEDGRCRVGGLILFGWLVGRTPSTPEDWHNVARECIRLHEVTRIWPQRPSFRSSLELLSESAGGDVDLSAMPPSVSALVRAAWSSLQREPQSVVHGDPGEGNILIDGDRVGFIDWDEARVDVSLLDLAALPVELEAPFDNPRMTAVRRAAVAWEVATSWLAEPEYARRRLAELQVASREHS